MKKQNIYFISNGKKVLVAKNVIATTTSSNGAVCYYYVSVENWKQFKKSHPNYTDDDISYCLVRQMIPGQIAPVGNFIVETLE